MCLRNPDRAPTAFTPVSGVKLTPGRAVLSGPQPPRARGTRRAAVPQAGMRWQERCAWGLRSLAAERPLPAGTPPPRGTENHECMPMTQVDDVQAACSGSLLVSVPKAGTHMVLKLYARAGYLNVGWGEVEPSELRAPREELERDLLQNPPVADIVRKFWYLKPGVILALLTHHARTQIGDTKSRMKLVGDNADPAVQAAWKEIRGLSDTTLFLPGLVVSTHQFSWDAGWRFLAAWGRTGVPSIVYCYRDPRAQIVSMIRFLAGNKLIARHPWAQVYRPILQSLGSMDRMLSFAISDSTFPFRDAYRQNRWLLYHPNVLKLRFEDLVGEEGGGSRQSQAAAIERWAAFLNVDVPAEKLAEGLFGGTDTFNKGRVDSWREVFEKHHLKAFDREFGDVLVEYGYAD